MITLAAPSPSTEVDIDRVEDLDDSNCFMIAPNFTPSNDLRIEEHSPTVLVIDDDAMNIHVLQAMLEERGYSTESAMSGPSALKLINKRVEMFKEDAEPFY